eukprot:s33_g24.t1
MNRVCASKLLLEDPDGPSCVTGPGGHQQVRSYSTFQSNNRLDRRIGCQGTSNGLLCDYEGPMRKAQVNQTSGTSGLKVSRLCKRLRHSQTCGVPRSKPLGRVLLCLEVTHLWKSIFYSLLVVIRGAGLTV